MAEFLRSAVASPRSRHYDPVAGTYLDLAYLDKNIIVCSMPTNEFPKIMYRNSLTDLRKLLTLRHGNHWHIWEFRSEGAGYNDSEFYNRVSHFPFPDHNPPPFAMLPTIIASLHKFLSQNLENVAVLHCKAGKGRSGTVFCSYLIAQHRWSAQSALAHFTARRMRAGFGEGVSILSQRRYISYVERWARDPNREYRPIPVVVTEVRILNAIRGLEVSVGAFKEDGRRIVQLYRFSNDDYAGENVVAASVVARSQSQIDTPSEDAEDGDNNEENDDDNAEFAWPATPTTPAQRAFVLPSDDDRPPSSPSDPTAPLYRSGSSRSVEYAHLHDPKQHPARHMDGTEIVLRPRADIHVTADVNIRVERKFYGPAGLSFLSATSYVWFNVFFEGDHDTGGTFVVKWEDMDGFKGTKNRGGKTFDRIAIDWLVCHPMENPDGTTVRGESIDLARIPSDDATQTIRSHCGASSSTESRSDTTPKLSPTETTTETPS
ncbi:protein-tyrosine phosphatase-like protein [Limtongia smithiae]|uniref:protein-tyrosine phosphatase-like protein n=1 Tax=Limtongia smithiae TaxID=1125753 RepID=UPI0034CF922D